MTAKKNPGLDWKVPPITFGGASLSGEGGGYGFGALSESEAENVIKASWEAGIQIFDTAPIYGFGLSEKRLGKYLPKDAIVVSKSGVDWHESKRVNMTNDPVVTQRMLHESLIRLKRDCIDLYMIHWPDPRVDIRVPMEVLSQAKKEGKIRYIGLCNTTLDDLKKAEQIAPIMAIQSELNLFNQEAFLRLGTKWESKLSMGWGTLDKGILSGRVTGQRKFDSFDARSWAPWWKKEDVKKKLEKKDKLENILKEFDLSLLNFCLSYSLNFFRLSTCLIGLKTPEDVFQVTSSLHLIPTEQRIREILERLENS